MLHTVQTRIRTSLNRQTAFLAVKSALFKSLHREKKRKNTFSSILSGFRCLFWYFLSQLGWGGEVVKIWNSDLSWDVLNGMDALHLGCGRNEECRKWILKNAVRTGQKRNMNCGNINALCCKVCKKFTILGALTTKWSVKKTCKNKMRTWPNKKICSSIVVLEITYIQATVWYLLKYSILKYLRCMCKLHN